MRNNNWQAKKLGDLCRVTAGQSPEGTYYNDKGNGLPFYQGKKEFQEKFIGKPQVWTTKITKEADTGDILMSVRAPVGPINFATQKICIGRGLAGIRPGKELDKDFLFYCLLSKKDEISGSEGAVFASINKSEVENIEIPNVSIDQQKRIVKKLDEVFEKIEKAKENTEKNLQNSRELFESYLGDIVVSSKEDWVLKKLKDVCNELFAGGDVPKNSYSRVKTKDYDVPIYANGFKDKGLYGFTNIERVKKTSITISARGTIGYAEIRRESYFPVVRLIVLVPNTEVVDVKYLYYVIHNFKFTNTGTSIPQLTVPMIKDIEFAVPSIPEQKMIVKKLDALSEQTKKLEENYRKKLADLEELKKSVLQSAFTPDSGFGETKKAFAGEL